MAQFSYASKATIGLYYSVTAVASSVGFILYQTCPLHVHDGSYLLWKQKSCLLLMLATEEPELSWLSPVVSIISTYDQPCSRKECKVVPQIARITRKKKTKMSG